SGMPIQTQGPVPVVFSKDGRRFAYLARLGQEWVLTVDGKESLRIPVTARGSTDIRLEFTGDDGKHLVFTRSASEGHEVWVDGKKWPGFFGSGGGGTEGTIDPLISPDGTRIAYLAQIARDKRALIVDGKDAGYMGDNLQFTGDSKHLISIGRTGNEQQLFVDGKPTVRAPAIVAVYTAPVGNRIIAVVGKMSRPGGHLDTYQLVVDGKPVEASTTKDNAPTLVFSPDGRRYAAVCGKTPNQFVVIDGKKAGQEYYSITGPDRMSVGPSLMFSADSTKVIYTATMMGSPTQYFLVTNDDESDGLVWPPRVWQSRDGKRVAYAGRLDAAGKEILSIDGKTQPLPPRTTPAELTFSPDGSRYAFTSAGGPAGAAVFVDGKAAEISGNLNFSPNSKHIAVFGHRPADQKRGLFVNGQHVFESQNNFGVRHRAFSPDSNHLFWVAMEPAAGANAGPGVFEWVTYVDGKPVARCDRNETSGKIFGVANAQFSTDQPAWEMGTKGALTFLGPVGDVIKRFTITPAADASVATMIAEAEAAPAKAAEAKKKAADADAQKRRKA
ncbi:MAG: hypothetical protein ACREF9_16785, partial [Opitutaceae bacterium]